MAAATEPSSATESAIAAESAGGAASVGVTCGEAVVTGDDEVGVASARERSARAARMRDRSCAFEVCESTHFRLTGVGRFVKMTS